MRLIKFSKMWVMAKATLPSILTDILRYDIEKGKRVKLKDCEVVSDFLFAKNNFYLVRKGKFYAVCISVDDELTLLTKTAACDGDIEKTPGEVIAEFRKGYLKNGITQDRIDFFLKDPVAYCKKYNKSAGQK